MGRIGLPALLAAALLGFVAVVPPPAAAACRTTSNAFFRWALEADPAACEGGNEMISGRTLWALVHDGRRFVAVGTSRASTEGETEPPTAAFRSADGVTWTEEPLPVPSTILARTHFEGSVHLTTRDGTISLVMAGAAASSPDGVTWQAGQPPSRSSIVTDAAAGASRWIAVGRGVAGDGRPKAPPAAIWASDDGRNWTRIHTYAAFCPEGIASHGDRFVAVGSDCADRPRAVILASPDGLRWTRHHLPTSRPTTLNDVIPIPSGYLAGGDDVSAKGAPGMGTWFSVDGTAWRRVAFFSDRRAGEELIKLVATSRGVVAIAEEGFLTDALAPTAFFSPTGTSGWRRAGSLPNPGYGSEDGDLILDAAASGRRVLAVGWFNDPDPGNFTRGGLVFVGDVRR